MPALSFETLVCQIIACIFVVEAQVSIVNLNATCNEKGMEVWVDFSIPFNGIILSKVPSAFNTDATCKFRERVFPSKTHTFLIQYDTCGLREIFVISPIGPSRYEIEIAFQSDPRYQEISDPVRKLSCIGPKYTFTESAFTVEMLNFTMISSEEEQFKSRIYVQKGVFPEMTPIKGNVKIGDNLTLLFYVSNNVNKLDMRVIDCYAYPDDTYAYPDDSYDDSERLHLTDTDGCSLKKTLIGQWTKAIFSEKNDTIFLSYAIIKAFRLTNSNQVHLKCKVEVCKNNCLNRCPGEMSDTKSISLQIIDELVNKYPTSIRHSAGGFGATSFKNPSAAVRQGGTGNASMKAN